MKLSVNTTAYTQCGWTWNKTLLRLVMSEYSSFQSGFAS